MTTEAAPNAEASVPEKKALLKGWLSKKGYSLLSSWKRRYFVLHADHTLSWYVSTADYEAGNDPKNTLDCSEIKK